MQEYARLKQLLRHMPFNAIECYDRSVSTVPTGE